MTDEARQQAARMLESARRETEALEEETKARCSTLEQETKTRCDAMVKQAETDAQGYWDDVSRRLEAFSAEHAELQQLLQLAARKQGGVS